MTEFEAYWFPVPGDLPSCGNRTDLFKKQRSHVYVDMGTDVKNKGELGTVDVPVMACVICGKDVRLCATSSALCTRSTSPLSVTRSWSAARWRFGMSELTASELIERAFGKISDAVGPLAIEHETEIKDALGELYLAGWYSEL